MLSAGDAGPALRLPKHRAGFSARAARAGPLPTTGTAAPKSSSLGHPGLGDMRTTPRLSTLWTVWTSSCVFRLVLVWEWASQSLGRLRGRTSGSAAMREVKATGPGLGNNRGVRARSSDVGQGRG